MNLFPTFAIIRQQAQSFYWDQLKAAANIYGFMIREQSVNDLATQSFKHPRTADGQCSVLSCRVNIFGRCARINNHTSIILCGRQNTCDNKSCSHVSDKLKQHVLSEAQFCRSQIFAIGKMGICSCWLLAAEASMVLFACYERVARNHIRMAFHFHQTLFSSCT